MALPVISNNSPSAGRIAWTAFSVVWNGVSYAVAAGNTDQSYTWWEYRNGSPALVAGATLPNLGIADLLLFLNKNGFGVLAPLTDVIEGSLIVPGTILGDALAVDQLRSEHHTAGSISTRELAAAAVTAEKMSIGSVTDSMVVNGSFEDGTQGWEVMAGSGVADVVTGVASAGANALRLTRGTVNNLHVGTALDKAIPVTATAGRSWYVAAVAGAGATLADGFYLRAYWYQANKTTAASTAFTDIASNVALSSAWQVFEGKVTPPANARYMRVVVINARSGSVMYVDEITAREVIVAAQIGDGQITTPLLAANAVKADNIDVESLNGITITGMLVRSGAGGQRVEMLSNRLDFYNAADQFAGSILGGSAVGAGGSTITINDRLRVGSFALPGSGSTDAQINSMEITDLYSSRQWDPSGNPLGPDLIFEHNETYNGGLGANTTSPFSLYFTGSFTLTRSTLLLITGDMRVTGATGADVSNKLFIGPSTVTDAQLIAAGYMRLPVASTKLDGAQSVWANSRVLRLPAGTYKVGGLTQVYGGSASTAVQDGVAPRRWQITRLGY